MGPVITLRTLINCVALVAAFSALLIQWRVDLLAIAIGILGLAYRPNRARARANVATVFVLVLIGIVFVAVFFATIKSAREASQRNTCINNLHQIGIALGSYHAVHKCYPPGYTADANGRPLVSWRLLLVPYMVSRPLYEEWKQHRDEPWDGPHNVKLSQTVLEFFHCPSDTGPITDTSYVAVVGPGTVWPINGQVTQSQITDGPANTIIVVEVTNSGINWMEPRDLDFNNLSLGINPKSGLGVSSGHPAVVCVQAADGRTVTIPAHLTVQELQALLTIGGGEKVVLP